MYKRFSLYIQTTEYKSTFNHNKHKNNKINNNNNNNSSSNNTTNN